MTATIIPLIPTLALMLRHERQETWTDLLEPGKGGVAREVRETINATLDHACEMEPEKVY